MNHEEVSNKEELIELINENGAQKMTVTLIRKNESIDVAVTPVAVEGDKYMLGFGSRMIWQGLEPLLIMKGMAVLEH